MIGSLTGADGVRWLQVMLPGRPNSSTGWIAQQGTRRLVTRWHIVVNLGARRVTVYRDGHVVRTLRAVVGKPSTPTPTGQFFVEETLRMTAGEPGGPFALALSARSNALQEFEGGPGQIALHGRDNLGGTLGAAESHGCVRLATAEHRLAGGAHRPGDTGDDLCGLKSATGPLTRLRSLRRAADAHRACSRRQLARSGSSGS